MDFITDLWTRISANPPLVSWIMIVAISLGAFILYGISRRVLQKIAGNAVKKTRNTWDDYLFKGGFFNRVSLLVPLIFIYALSNKMGIYQSMIQKIISALMILMGTRVVSLFFESILIGFQKKQLKGRSLSGVVQAGKLVIYILAVILIAAVLMEKSPRALLGGIGAMTAIITLVFKDTILSLVASIQFSLNKTLKVGDWIEVPEVGADGDVVDITLHNVMVQNWDKTLISIPTHRFLEQGFKNWKGMSDAGGRRIKRSILIDLHSIRFLDENGLSKLREIDLIREYLSQRSQEIKDENDMHKVNSKIPVNGRALTNIGVFRKYAQAYLENLGTIRKDMTLMVRQLEPQHRGVPLQIYCFTKDTAWVNYESIQGDIFDHMLAAISWFGLKLYQSPSGGDIAALISD